MAVTALEIDSRTPFAGGMTFGEVGGYEQIDGKARFAVDPDHPSNQVITDLGSAPKNSAKRVTFSTDFRILRPIDPRRGRKRLLLDVVNRGRQRILRYANEAADNPDFTAPLDPGNGFLMRQGYTVVWCGWQHDVPDTPGLLRIDVPGAVNSQGPISGRILVTIQPNQTSQVQLAADRQHRPYPASDLQDPEARLTVQDHDYGPVMEIPRNEWSFARLEDTRLVPDGRHVYLASGFQAGKIYRVIYRTASAPVVGLGLAATRDLVSFLRHEDDREGNPCHGEIDRAYAFGASQSGRFLRQFLHLSLNQDEENQPVFDGIIAHIAGARRGEFNLRFGQPSSVIEQSVASLFPFSDLEQTDPETGATEGLLSNLAKLGPLPKVMFTNTSAEYWGGHASLIHTDTEGILDIEASDSVRIYHFAGTQHAGGTFPLADADASSGARGAHSFNCVDYAPLLRSALTRLDRWVSLGEAPPPSRHPRLGDGTAVPPEQTEQVFRAIPGVSFPKYHRYLARLDFGLENGVATKLPAEVGKPYPNLVSAVDQDGNELAGIRLPDISVPVGTHTGWNTRHADTGEPGLSLRMMGSTIPFAATKTQREASGDPRASIEERYASRDEYLNKVRTAAQGLASAGYLLEEDLETVLENAAKRYDFLQVGAAEVQLADD